MDVTEKIITRAVTPEDMQIRENVANPDHVGRIVEGVVVPYGRRQRINEDLTEIIAHGSSAHQLSAANRLQFTSDHQSNMKERLPIPEWLLGRGMELREVPAGLWGAFLVSRTPLGLAVLELVRDKALDELSIGFTQPAGGSRRLADGTVERTKINLFEVALVPRGAYGRAARVLATRAEDEERATEARQQERGGVRDLQAWLAGARRAVPALPGSG